MQIELRHRPSFSVARVHLSPSESFEAEAGAMAAHSAGVQIAAAARGGVMKSLKRATLGGESMFTTTFSASPQGPGWVDLAPNLFGDIALVEVTPEVPWAVTRGSWLGNSPTVALDTKWGGRSMLLGGEGGFIVLASGRGQLLVSALGAIDHITLRAGQGFVLDTGHLVAYQATAQVSVRRAASGIMATVKSGEGLVMDVQGPGEILTQSRNPGALMSWIASHMPSRD